MSDNKITFGKVFWPALIAVLLAGIITVIFTFTAISGLVASSFISDKGTSGEDKTILHLTLNGQINEFSHTKVDVYNMSVKSNYGLSEILYGFEKAKSDKNVKGVYIEIKNSDFGYATAKELRNAIDQFQKESGKFVVAYLSGEYVSQKNYYISSVAKEIYGFPTTNFQFTGIGTEIMYYKNTLDKLGVEMQVIRGKNNDFKSAVEPFFRTNMSDSSRVQVERYIHNIWGEMLGDISKSRAVTISKLNEYADELVITNSKDAVRLKLIDGLKYNDEIVELLSKKAKMEAKDLKLYPFEKYAKEKFNQNQTLESASKDKSVALILAEGDISVSGSGLTSTKICKYIREAVDDESVKTIVFRVNSPGGSALASDEIAREIALANKKKTVIVSMGDYAASGGYYIAALATRIFASPMTITGSIGVFGTIPYTGKALEDKLGLTFDRAQTNKSSVLSTNRKLTEKELDKIQKEVDVIYDDFVSIVSSGRKMTKEQVNRVARGRVWTGQDAKKLGLVDELGTLNDAISYAAKKANVSPTNLKVWPKIKETPFEMLLSQLEDSDDLIDSKVQFPAEIIEYYNQLKKIEQFNGILMRMPYDINLK